MHVTSRKQQCRRTTNQSLIPLRQPSIQVVTLVILRVAPLLGMWNCIVGCNKVHVYLFPCPSHSNKVHVYLFPCPSHSNKVHVYLFPCPSHSNKVIYRKSNAVCHSILHNSIRIIWGSAPPRKTFKLYIIKLLLHVFIVFTLWKYICVTHWKTSFSK